MAVNQQDAGWEVVRGWLDTLADSDVEEFEYQSRTLRVRLHRQPAAVRARRTDVNADTASALPTVRAPLTGVFYAAPAPDADPYVREGDWIEPRQVVGLIETMKVFNEVQADSHGRVVHVHVKTGELVQQGAVLLTVDPQAAAPAESA